MSTSQIFTIGTALRRAEDNGVPVEVLVEGQWLRGDIAGLDGDGLVLVTPERTQCVVRNAHISVVRILANLSFDDETPSEPQATSYQSGSTTYDSPREWESAGAAGSTGAAATAGAPAAEDTSPFRWASTHGSVSPEPGPVVSETHDERLVLGAADEDGLALGAGHDDEALVLDAGDEGPLELGSSWQAGEAPVAHETPEPVTEVVAEEPAGPVAEQPTEAVTEASAEEPSHESPEPTGAEVIELRPEPVAEQPVAEQPVAEQPVGEQPGAARETSDDLVSRLLAESMREAGIEPEQPATAAANPEPATASDPENAPETSVDTAGDGAPSELLHPEKAPADDDEPRIFALPAPSVTATAAAPVNAPLAAEPAPSPAPAAPAEPTPAAEVAPAPAAEPATPAAAPAAAGDDWRSMLEGLRSEAAAPQSGAQNAQPEEKRRGRRLVMR